MGNRVPIAAWEREGDRPPFMLLGLHGLVSPGDSVQCRSLITRAEMPREKIAGIAFERQASSVKRQASKNRRGWRCVHGGGVGADALRH
jgi:hypothetical protein